MNPKLISIYDYIKNINVFWRQIGIESLIKTEIESRGCPKNELELSLKKVRVKKDKKEEKK